MNSHLPAEVGISLGFAHMGAQGRAEQLCESLALLEAMPYSFQTQEDRSSDEPFEAALRTAHVALGNATVLLDDTAGIGRYVALVRPDSIVMLSKWSKYRLKVWATDRDMAQRIFSLIEKDIPPTVEIDPNHIRVDFWSDGSPPMSRKRRLVVPTWDEISRNYSAQTAPALARLTTLTEGAMGGRMLLWHGVPGTGKTYAIRALLNSWREWCDGHYIMDPEAFFGNPSYMLEVMLGRDNGEDLEYETPVPYYEGKPKPWKLLVAEDADEFLSTDAKERKGQSMSRLLNLTDGLLGQGFQVMILITTNEPLDKIHPAVTRAGRCLANVEFTRLSTDESQAWLPSNYPDKIALPRTIAELYAMAGGSQPVLSEAKRSGKLGF